MKKILENFYVGGDKDYLEYREAFDLVIQAAKEPWHREAVGYTGRGAPKDSPHYLWKEVSGRPDRLVLNLVDADDVKYISTPVIARALSALSVLEEYKRVLLHCNQGVSRAPSIAFCYLYLNGLVKSIQDFKENVYPDYTPGKGMEDWIKRNILF